MATEKHLSRALELFAEAVAELVQAGMPAEGNCQFMPAAFDADDAAKYLGIGRTKLFAYRDAGSVKTITIGGRPKYLKKDLDRLLAKLEKG